MRSWDSSRPITTTTRGQASRSGCRARPRRASWSTGTSAARPSTPSRCAGRASATTRRGGGASARASPATTSTSLSRSSAWPGGGGGGGDRGGPPRDYIYQPFPQLGLARVGPDLANIADRKPTAPDEEDLLRMLYAGSEGMPPYRFLFEERRVGAGAQHSDLALKLTGAPEPRPGWEIAPRAWVLRRSRAGPPGPGPGWEIVPAARGRALVAYLASLKSPCDYPEAFP